MSLRLETDMGVLTALLGGEIDHHTAKELREGMVRFAACGCFVYAFAQQRAVHCGTECLVFGIRGETYS